VKTVT
jgi:hypothetical protein